MTENKSTIQTAAGVPERERAVLVAVVRDSQELRQSEEYLDELEFLAETADITTVRRFSQRLPQPSSRIYVGPGKLEEIAAYCEEHAVDVAIFDDELTPAQTRNIERAMPCRILDRTRLILDIFLARAQTAYAKTQVQLAQYEYMLPRLAGLWTHLERQRGGTGTRDRNRPPYRTQPHLEIEGGSQKDRPPDGRAALQPRTAGARGAGRI